MRRCRDERSFDTLIQTAARSVGVDPALIKAHVAVESDFNPRAFRSEPQIHDASHGLMQLLYGTARQLGYPGEIGDATQLTGLYAPGTNLYLGAKLIAQNLRMARSTDAAISAYNAGFSKLRAGDAKRDAQGNIVNQAYVDKVRSCWTYYAPQWGGDGPPPAAPPVPGARAEGSQAGFLASLSPAWLALIVTGLAALAVRLLRRGT